MTDVSREYPRIVNRLLGLFIESPEQAAGPVIHLAISPEVDGISGGYFIKNKQSEPQLPHENWSLQSDMIWTETKRLLEGYSCLPE